MTKFACGWGYGCNGRGKSSRVVGGADNKKNDPGCNRGGFGDCGGAWESLRPEGLSYRRRRKAAPTRWQLVAGYRFVRGFSVLLGSGAAVAIGRGDPDRLIGVGEVCRNGLGDVGNRANLHDRRLGLLQNQFFVDGADPSLLFESHLAADAVLLGSGQRNVVLQVANACRIIGINDQRVLVGAEVDALALGVNLVFPVVLVPLGHGRVLVHVFDDVAPAHTGVVRAEADFALLRAVRNDAHFGAAEVVVEKILEPHAGDEEEVPRVLGAALHGIFVGALRGSLAVLAGGTLRQRPGLVKLLEEVPKLQTLRPLERVIVLQERHGHHEVGEALAASGVGDGGDVRGKLLRVQEARNRRPFLGFLVDHQRGAHAAVRVAAAGERTPLGFVALDHVGKAGKGADEGDGEPVAGRLNLANLIADVLRKMRKGVTLAEAALRGDVLVAAGKRNRLEADERNFLGVFHREFHDGADLVVVHVVDDGHDQHDFNARFVQVFDAAQLDVEQVADLAVAVGVVADAVELQVGVAQSGFERLLCEFLALGEFDAVGGRLNGVISNLAGVADGVEEMRAHGRLAAGELHGHLAARLDFHRVVQNFYDFVPAQFVDVANLVGVHEAGIAHHVAAVGEVDGEHGAAAIAHVRRAVLVQAFIVVRGNIAAGELLLDPLQEVGVNGHHVFIVAVQRAVFHHPYLAVALDNLRLDFTDLFAHQVAPVLFTLDDGFARFFHAGRAERVGLARKAESWPGLFPGFQQRLIGPLRGDRRIRILLVEMLNGIEGDTRRLAKHPVQGPENLRANRVGHTAVASLSESCEQNL